MKDASIPSADVGVEPEACQRPKWSEALVTRNEEFWLEVIRAAARDTDPAPDLAKVRAIREIFKPDSPRKALVENKAHRYELG